MLSRFAFQGESLVQKAIFGLRSIAQCLVHEKARYNSTITTGRIFGGLAFGTSCVAGL